MVDAGVLGTGRLAAEGNPIGVTTKGVDISLHPAQHSLLVQYAIVVVEMAFGI